MKNTAKKRELFKDYINGLLDIEFEIFDNNLPKLHESEADLLARVKNELKDDGQYLDETQGLDKRIKNRLKNKFNTVYMALDLKNSDQEIRKLLSEEITFYNLNAAKKMLRKVLKRRTNIQNIHTLLLLFDELRSFYLRQKERNEITSYYNLLETNLPFIDFNLNVSYFLRELDVAIKDTNELSVLDDQVQKIKEYVNDDMIIGGYKFKLMTLLIQHRINVGEWDEALKDALELEGIMKNGAMYSWGNLSHLLSLLVKVYNQTYDKEKYEYYSMQLQVCESKTEIIETDIINIDTIFNDRDDVMSKNVLKKIEKLSSKIDSEKTSLYLRLARTELAIKEKDYSKALSYNDLFFMDIHNKQVREFLDKIYIHRFIILLNRARYEDVIKLFESKITQKRILNLERNGKLLIYPYIIYDIAKLKLGEQNKEKTLSNIFRMLDYYLYNNHFDCYNILNKCIGYTFENLSVNEKERLKLERMKSMVEDTLDKIN